MKETATEQLVHALFAQEQRHLGLSHLDPDEGGVSLVRTAADTACYWVFAESIQAAPYVTIPKRNMRKGYLVDIGRMFAADGA